MYCNSSAMALCMMYCSSSAALSTQSGLASGHLFNFHYVNILQIDVPHVKCKGAGGTCTRVETLGMKTQFANNSILAKMLGQEQTDATT